MHLSKLTQQYTQKGKFYCICIILYFFLNGKHKQGGIDVVIPGIKMHKLHREHKVYEGMVKDGTKVLRSDCWDNAEQQRKAFGRQWGHVQSFDQWSGRVRSVP